MKSLISRSRIRICKQLLVQSTGNNIRRWYSSEKVSVWWDMDDGCAVPAGVNVNTTRSIINAVRDNRILQFAKSNHHLVNLVHIPNPDITVIRNRKQQCMDTWPPFMQWVSRIFPPAHNVFICNNTRFAGILNNLRTDYNITWWYWKDLGVKRENTSSSELLPGRPWYLIYKGICKDPFTMSVSDHKLPMMIEEDSSNAELVCHYRHRPVPEALVCHLLEILYCFPGGLTITELRNELKAHRVSINEGFFYGYQKFVHLLQALPYIVDVQSRPDGQFIVRHAIYAMYQSLLSLNANSGEQSYGYDNNYEYRRVPRDVIHLLRRIVWVHPEGLSITELKNELKKSNVVVDYDAFYGYGTLSRLLLALPQCVVVESLADGVIFVRCPPTEYEIGYHVLGVGLDGVDSGSIGVVSCDFFQGNPYEGGFPSSDDDVYERSSDDDVYERSSDDDVYERSYALKKSKSDDSNVGDERMAKKDLALQEDIDQITKAFGKDEA